MENTAIRLHPYFISYRLCTKIDHNCISTTNIFQTIQAAEKERQEWTGIVIIMELPEMFPLTCLTVSSGEASRTSTAVAVDSILTRAVIARITGTLIDI